MRRLQPLLVLIVLGAPRAIYPQSDTPSTGDVVVVGLGADDLAPGTGGASVSADLIHPLAGGSVWAGLESVTIGRMGWVVGRAGGVWRLNSRVTGDALVTVGPGSSAGDRFVYRQLRGGVSYSLIPGRLVLDGGGQAFDIAALRGQILSAGATVLSHRRLATRLRYGRSAGGNYDAEYLLVRADLRSDRIGALAGLSVGRSGPGPQELSLVGSAAASRREIFAGIVVPVRGLELTAVLSHGWSEAARRESIVLISRIPLR
jgi:hypothetical protein